MRIVAADDRRRTSSMNSPQAERASDPFIHKKLAAASARNLAFAAVGLADSKWDLAAGVG